MDRRRDQETGDLGSTSSRIPPTSVATTGRAQAIASMTAIGSASTLEPSENTSKAGSTDSTSSTAPVRMNGPRAPSADPLLDPLALRAVTHHDEARTRLYAGDLGRRVNETHDVLLRSQRSDDADDERALRKAQ